MIDTRMKINDYEDFSEDFDNSDDDPLEKAIQSKYVAAKSFICPTDRKILSSTMSQIY